MNTKEMKELQWFLDRIGKRIYRDDNKCDCHDCKNILENGLIVSDKDHAEYLFDIQNDFMADGINLNYRDIK